jgi:FMN-binding domain
MLKRLFIVVTLMAVAVNATAKGVYLTAEKFIAGSFDASSVTTKTLWLSGENKKKAEQILNHPLGLRTRYWVSGKRTAWIFEGIGKELPITIGIVVDNHQIMDVRILAFRESRGWEVRYPSFTQQFTRLTLVKDQQLSGSIDGISGATLSVRAVTRAAKAALFFHSIVP